MKSDDFSSGKRTLITSNDWQINSIRSSTLFVRKTCRRHSAPKMAFWPNQNDSDTMSIFMVSVRIESKWVESQPFETKKKHNKNLPILSLSKNWMIFSAACDASYCWYTNAGQACDLLWYLNILDLSDSLRRSFHKLFESPPNTGCGKTISGKMVTLATRGVHARCSGARLWKYSSVFEKWREFSSESSSNENTKSVWKKSS